MTKSIASITSLLVNLKTVNCSLLIKLRQLGFDPELTLGAEKEYTVKTLINAIDTLSIQFLTITANHNQFLQRTSYNERKTIEDCLKSLYQCLLQTQQELIEFHPAEYQCHSTHALAYISDNGENRKLKLLDAAHYIDQIKPYCRMLEMIVAHERIHALSAVLENLLSRDTKILDEENELTEEQSNALELSQYLIRQAL
ncbi:hypothetical protein MNBD_GAMMA09-1609 [hydrothermal vent metagenome]|uniref:Uncharacterized protein n=1 Tax=hydrothermal vent metagenome TaxID=652676 RepID=A0A3B0XRV0_9ZZZZ